MNGTCQCGCGEATGGLFKPGHDQKLRARIEADVGGLLALHSLAMAAKDYADGRKSLDQLGAVVKATIKG